jgi:hypothetical protein
MHVQNKTATGEKARAANEKKLWAMARKTMLACSTALREGAVGKALTMFGIAQGLRDMALSPARQEREGCEVEALYPLAREIMAGMGEVVDALIPFVKKSKRKPWYVKYGGVVPKI